jgi:hypothetical protein
MQDESLWRSRLRWRWKGALQWPAFVALCLLDAVLLGVLPIAGDGGTGFVPAFLLAMFFNLVAVALIGPAAAVVLRRRRPDLPKVIAQDHAGTAALVLVTLGFLGLGLLHAPARHEAEHDLAAQAQAASRYVSTRAPEPYRSHARSMTTLKLDDELYRTCVPGDDPDRWFCLFVSTRESPPGIDVDGNRESNASLDRLGAYR